MHPFLTRTALSGFFSVILFLCGTSQAGAHPEPLTYEPPVSAVLQVSPSAVHITFSERIEPKASSLTLIDPHGQQVQGTSVTVTASDPYTLNAAVPQLSPGTYLVSWEAISADDGHFTKGTYTFAIGNAQSNAATNIGASQIPHETDYLQATAIFLELLGQALLLALFVLHIVIFRRTISQQSDDLKSLYERRWMIAVVIGFLLIFTGSICYLLFEINTLALGENISQANAFWIFLTTVTARYDIVRLLIAIVFFVLCLCLRKNILRSKRYTWSEAFLLLLVCAMALLRARVSHAEASAFHPVISVIINWIHLLSKDLWVGGLVILICLFVPLLVRSKDVRSLALALTGFSQLLSLMLITGGVSGLYIIWLHLKDWSNLATSHWGVTFMGLAGLAVMLLLVRLYSQFHVDREFVKSVHMKEDNAEAQRTVWYALIFEACTGLAVLYVSSILIITSPPLPSKDTYTQSIFSPFNISIIVIALLIIIAGVLLYLFSTRNRNTAFIAKPFKSELWQMPIKEWLIVAGICIVFLIFFGAMTIAHTHGGNVVLQ